jgi:taspase (threonine aspartase 1)
MDAGIMDGSSLLFGAVGAVPGIKNPILVAKLMVEEQQKGLLPLGRVPPGFLVGEGAREWAIKHGVSSVPQENLISEKSLKLYRHYKKKLDTYLKMHLIPAAIATQGGVSKKREREPDSPVTNGVKQKFANNHHHEDDDRVTDTVGVVVMDRHGRVASTVSSGGIALKQPGRVGQASCFGCGCWAQGGMGPQGLSVGISTTGCGEHLVRTFLARECATSLGNADAENPPIVVLQNVMRNKFCESPFLESVPEKLGGAICMQYDARCGRGEFLWTHTTASMGIAYMTTADNKATTVMSRLPPKNEFEMAAAAAAPKKSETTILVEGVPFYTTPAAVVESTRA